MDHLPFHPLWQYRWCNQRDFFFCFFVEYHTFLLFFTVGRRKPEKPRDCSAESCEPHKTRRLYCSVVPLPREQRLCCSCYMGHVKTGKKDLCGNELQFAVTVMEFSRRGNLFFLRSEQDGWEKYFGIQGVQASQTLVLLVNCAISSSTIAKPVVLSKKQTCVLLHRTKQCVWRIINPFLYLSELNTHLCIVLLICFVFFPLS